ncbi:hypothetical protein ACFW04_011914 [Cataglyphis niger]
MISKRILSAIKNIKFINERLGVFVEDKWYRIAIINAKIFSSKSHILNTKIFINKLSPDENTRNQIDYIFADKRRHTSYSMLGLLGERINDSQQTKLTGNRWKLNEQNITEGEDRIKYAIKITNKFWENIRDTIVKSAEVTEGFYKRNRSKQWFVEKCVKIATLRNEARIAWLTHNTEEIREQFLNTLLTAAPIMFKNKKYQYLKHKIEEIDENCQNSNAICIHVDKKFRKEFQNYGKIETIEIHTAEFIINEPTIVKVKSAIKKLKNHKAPNLIVIPIFKKENKMKCNNYRGILRVSACYKVLSNILLMKLAASYADEIIGDHQSVFEDRLTTDQIFNIHNDLKQGDALSSFLFNLMSEGGLQLNDITQLLTYADDIIFLGDNSETIINNTKTLLDKTKEFKLQINVEKTKYMVINIIQNIRKCRRLDRDKIFERVSNFILRLLSEHLKIRIYKTIILPIILYGYES